jgi:hypothetical protein
MEQSHSSEYYRSLEIIQNSDDYHTEDLRRALIYIRGYEDALEYLNKTK